MALCWNTESGCRTPSPYLTNIPLFFRQPIDSITVELSPGMTPVASVSLSPVREGKKSPVKSNVTPVKSDVSSAKVDIKSDSNKDCGEGIGGANPNEASSVQRAQIKSPPRDTNNANYYEEEDDELQSSEASYEAEFNQPQHVKDEMYKREKNTMRSPTEGKACLDRYRLASS
eukprot:scaffold13629_cov193-Alexandrium_tamarense.AAC.1